MEAEIAGGRCATAPTVWQPLFNGNHDDFDRIPSVGIPEFQGVLHPTVCCDWRDAFPGLVTYNRFVEWMPSTLIPLCAYLRHCFGTCTGISFIDSTSLKVCHNRRINDHKVFQPLAARGNLGGLVLWLQATPGCQRARGIAQRRPHPWQHR